LHIFRTHNNEIQEECSSGLPRQVVNQSNKVLSCFLTFHHSFYLTWKQNDEIMVLEVFSLTFHAQGQRARKFKWCYWTRFADLFP